jgi:hypothetical protein
MCLYALREYRAWSQRLAHPALLSWARRTCELLSENRLQVSRLVAQASCLWGGRASCPAREVQLRPNSPRETPGGPTGRMPVPRLG